MTKLPPATALVLAVDALPRPRTWSSIPTEWYRHIVKERADSRGRNGESRAFCDHLACLILDDILQFYRPVEITDDGDALLCRRFTGDRLIQTYQHWQDRFGASKHQVRASVELLCHLGLIERDLVTLCDPDGRQFNNRMAVAPVVPAIERISRPAEPESPRAPSPTTLPAQFVIASDAGGKDDPDAGGKGGETTPAGEEGLCPPPQRGSADLGTAQEPLGTSRENQESEGTYTPGTYNPKDFHNSAHAGMHARGETLEALIDRVLKTVKGPPARASPRRAKPKTTPTKARRPSEGEGLHDDSRLREAGKLIEEWERLVQRRMRTEGREIAGDYEQRATQWRWACYRWLTAGYTADRIVWTLQRADTLGYPIDGPAAIKKCWHYLSDPASNLMPWRGGRAAKPSPAPEPAPSSGGRQKLPDDYQTLDDFLFGPGGPAEEKLSAS